MTETGLKELYYIRSLSVEEMADHICSLPYTLVESILEAALEYGDARLDFFTLMIRILKKNTHVCNAKRALRKLLKVCEVSGCVGSFDFGEWEAIRDEENATANIEPPKIIKDLIDAGQLEELPINRQYKPFKTLRQFIFWCVDNNYGDDLCVPFISHYIFHEGVTNRSIDEYIRTAKREQGVQ
jgi:hypothetical protein